jgi:oligoribonuclease
MDYRFLWIDLEMSGLNPLQHRILEAACIITDGKCQKVLSGPEIIINCD